jgi:hypothetical protein
MHGVLTFTGDNANNDSLTVFVDCMDALGAVTRQTAAITVLPKVTTAAFLGEAQGDILKSFESADWNSALGKRFFVSSIHIQSIPAELTFRRKSWSTNQILEF